MLTKIRAKLARRRLPRCLYCRQLIDGKRFCSDACADEFRDNAAY